MNMDDIEREFWGDQREQPTRVRLARVIRSLRDQFDFTSRGKNWSEGEVHDFFSEILGDFGAEGKAAGDVNPDGARISGLETTAPAASGSPAADHPSYTDYMNGTMPMKVAPAATPDVCEFVGAPGNYRRSCNGSLSIYSEPVPPLACAFCGKPISFKSDAAR